MINSWQGLRVMAMFFIFFFHCSIIIDIEILDKIYELIFYDGQLAVVLFFILSGAVTYLSMIKSNKDYKINDSIRFAWRKIKRWYPLHIFILIVLFIRSFNSVNLAKEIYLFFINLFLIQSYIPNIEVYFSYNSLSWFISSLGLGYLLSIIFFKIINKIHYNKIKYFILLIYLIQLILVILWMNSKLKHWFFYINPFFRSLDFLIGMLLGKIIKNNDKNNKDKKYSYLELFVVSIFIFLYCLGRYLPIVFRYGVYYSPILILILYVFYFEKGIFSKVLSNKLFNKLATISFEFYMIHQLIIFKVGGYINNDILAIFISLILSLVLAIMIKKVIELIYLLKNYISKNYKKCIFKSNI